MSDAHFHWPDSAEARVEQLEAELALARSDAAVEREYRGITDEPEPTTAPATTGPNTFAEAINAATTPEEVMRLHAQAQEVDRSITGPAPYQATEVELQAWLAINDEQAFYDEGIRLGKIDANVQRPPR